MSLASASRQMGEKSPQRLKDVVAGRQKCPAELVAKLHGIGVDIFYVLTAEKRPGLTVAGSSPPYSGESRPQSEGDTSLESVLILRQVITDLSRIVHQQHLELTPDAQARAISAAYAVALRYRLEKDLDSDLEPVIASALLAAI